MCWKGTDCLKIIPNGDIYLATCEVFKKGGAPIGSIHDFKNIKWATGPQRCDKRRCNCVAELRTVRKFK